MSAVDPTIRTIESSIRECTAHIERMSNGETVLRGDFPLNEERLDTMGETNLAHLDQFIYRFMRLQDSMATRLFPSLYSWLEESSEPTPFLDVLNRLEQLRVVPSAVEWQRFRNLRNSLAHDYPETRKQTVSTLNELYTTWRKLEQMFNQARIYFEERADRQEQSR